MYCCEGWFDLVSWNAFAVLFCWSHASWICCWFIAPKLCCGAHHKSGINTETVSLVCFKVNKLVRWSCPSISNQRINVKTLSQRRANANFYLIYFIYYWLTNPKHILKRVIVVKKLKVLRRRASGCIVWIWVYYSRGIWMRNRAKQRPTNTRCKWDILRSRLDYKYSSVKKIPCHWQYFERRDPLHHHLVAQCTHIGTGRRWLSFD